MSEFEHKFAATVRLAILSELSLQRDATASSAYLLPMIDLLGPRRSREWVETQLSKLEELGAVNLRRVDLPGIGNVGVATLTRTGRDHVDRRAQLAGVAVPADPE